MSTPEPSEAEASYRAFVKQRYKGKQFSPDERSFLEDYRASLKLPPERARAIEQEVLGEGNSTRQDPSSHPTIEPDSGKGSDPSKSLATNTDTNTRVGQEFNSDDDETKPPTPPPGSSEEYLINFNLYKEKLRQAIHAEGLSLSPETIAQLRQRAKELNLITQRAKELSLRPEDPPYINSLKQYARDLRQAIQIEDLSLNPERKPYLNQRATLLQLDEPDVKYLQAIELYRREMRRLVRSEGLSLSPEAKAHLAQLAKQQNLTNGDVEYVQRLVDYGQAVLQLLRSAPYDPADEAGEQEKKERKQTLAKRYRLDNDDASDIDREMLAEYYLNPSVPPKSPSQPSYAPELVPFFEVLEGHLKAGKLEEADITTGEILLKVVAPRQGWLDAESLLQESIPKKDKGAEAIQEINRLWIEYSNGKFGFSRQLAIYRQSQVKGPARNSNIDYRQNRERSLAFSKRVGWWIRGLEFFKPYSYLNFTLDAPEGHLPAYWFWHIPRAQAGQLGNLWLLAERGGCRVDAFTIPAFMDMLERCGIKPNAGKRQMTAMEPTRPVEKGNAKPAGEETFETEMYL